MGKASSNKKVARAARTGGSARGGQSRALLFPAILAVVVILGIVLIVVSASDNQSDASVEPRLGTHWHAAYGVYLCDEFMPPLSDRRDVTVHNLHSHQDGLVHIHPFSSAAAGYDATLEVFFDTVGLEVSEDRIEYPGGPEVTNGDDCNGEPGQVQLAVWDPTEFNSRGLATTWADEPQIVAGDPNDFRPQDDQLITIAFVPEGAEIPRPPSAGALAAPADEVPPGQAPATAPPATAPDEGSTEGDTSEDGTTDTTAASGDDGEGTTDTTSDATTETTSAE